jgi:hypothetical protein
MSMMGEAGVDVLLFEAGGFRLGADAGAVVRVASHRPEDPQAATFGAVRSGGREIVARGRGGTTQAVSVDTILGVRRVKPSDLRPLPRFLLGRVHPAVIGFAVLEETLVALVELSEVEGAEAEPG